MDRMSTITVKPEHEETTPFLAHQMSMRDDTSTGTTTRAARYGSLLVGLRFSYAQARWTQGFLSGSGHRSVKPYVHWCCITVCACSRARMNCC
jgi:hypothetical protein